MADDCVYPVVESDDRVYPTVSMDTANHSVVDGEQVGYLQTLTWEYPLPPRIYILHEPGITIYDRTDYSTVVAHATPALNGFYHGALDSEYLYTTLNTGIARFDVSTLEYIDTTPFGTGQTYRPVLKEGYLYFGSADKNIYKVDVSDLSVVGQFTGALNTLLDLEWGRDGYLYSADWNGDVRKIDPSTMTQVGGTLHFVQDYNALSYGADGYLYAGNDYDRVYKIDPAAMAHVGDPWVVYGQCDAVLYAPDDMVYAGNVYGTVRKATPGFLVSPDTYLYPEGSTGSRVTVLAWDPDQNYLLVGGPGGALDMVDPTTMAHVAQLTLGDNISDCIVT